MDTMQDYIYEEKAVLSPILKKNVFDKKTNEKKSTNLLILATGSSTTLVWRRKPTLRILWRANVEIQEPLNFAHYGKLSPSIDTVIAVSQSGKSASTIDAVKMIQKQEIPILLSQMTYKVRLLWMLHRLLI